MSANVTRHQAFVLVEMADQLTRDLVPDHDVQAVDAVLHQVSDAFTALHDGSDHHAAHLAAEVLATMLGPRAPRQDGDT
jgi:hypothetical protein